MLAKKNFAGTLLRGLLREHEDQASPRQHMAPGTTVVTSVRWEPAGEVNQHAEEGNLGPR